MDGPETSWPLPACPTKGVTKAHLPWQGGERRKVVQPGAMVVAGEI